MLSLRNTSPWGCKPPKKHVLACERTPSLDGNGHSDTQPYHCIHPKPPVLPDAVRCGVCDKERESVCVCVCVCILSQNVLTSTAYPPPPHTHKDQRSLFASVGFCSHPSVRLNYTFSTTIQTPLEVDTTWGRIHNSACTDMKPVYNLSRVNVIHNHLL